MSYPFATPWTVARQAPLSMGFSREEYWSVLPFPSPGDLPDPGIEHASPAWQADFLTTEPPGKTQLVVGKTAKWEQGQGRHFEKRCEYQPHSAGV